MSSARPWSTRVPGCPFDRALANALLRASRSVPILMYTAQDVGAVQITGMPLKRFINEGDYYAWRRALANPAQAAPYAIALDGDPVAQAIREHPADMSVINVICSTGQPCARVYRSAKISFVLEVAISSGSGRFRSQSRPLEQALE